MLGTSLIHTCIVVGFMALLVATAIKDVQSFTIPNRYSLSIAILYPAHVLSAPAPVTWWIGLAISAVLFVIGFIVYARGWVGAGDSKLVAAVGLWAGGDLIAEFLILTGLAGGVMAAAIWLRHRMTRAASLGMIFFTESAPGFQKRPMPYGVAIGAGGLYVAFTVLGLV